MRQELLSPGVTAMVKQMKSHIFLGRCGKTKPEQKKRKLSSLPLKWVRESISDNTNHMELTGRKRTVWQAMVKATVG